MPLSFKEIDDIERKYGKKRVNFIFYLFIVKQRSVRWIAIRAGLRRKNVENILRISFYKMDSVIAAAESDVEKMKNTLNKLHAAVGPGTRKKMEQALKRIK